MFSFPMNTPFRPLHPCLSGLLTQPHCLSLQRYCHLQGSPKASLPPASPSVFFSGQFASCLSDDLLLLSSSVGHPSLLSQHQAALCYLHPRCYFPTSCNTKLGDPEGRAWDPFVCFAVHPQSSAQLGKYPRNPESRVPVLFAFVCLYTC